MRRHDAKILASELVQLIEAMIEAMIEARESTRSGVLSPEKIREGFVAMAADILERVQKDS